MAHVSAEDSDESPETVEDSLPEGEVSQAVLSELEDLAKDQETSRTGKLGGYSVDELTLAVHHFLQQEEVLPLSSRVRILKRSFDELLSGTTVDSITINRFRTALSKFNKKRAEQQAIAEAAKAENSEKKKSVARSTKGYRRKRQS